MTSTYMERHTSALLSPETPEETTLSNLTRELGVVADRYRGDAVMSQAVESLASSIIKLASDGETGRIDPTTLIHKVTDMVNRAGHNGDNL